MKNKKILILIIVILLVIALLGGTLAWYVWSTSSDEDVQVIAGLEAATVLYGGGEDITNVSLKPVASKEEGIVKKIQIKYLEDVYYTLSFNLYLDVIQLDEGLKDTSFKYQIYKDNSTTPIKEGNFSSDYLNNNLVTCSTNNTNHIVLLSNEKITSAISTYTLYIWIDGTMPNPNTMQNQSFNFKLHADGQNAVLEEFQNNISEYITTLYTKASKTTVTNNNIKYNYATSVSLMNDRLGGTTADYDAGNIRYYGANPNNYIYFNCSDYANQTADTCELWRIIGVFDDKVKIIRNESIGTFAWDNKPSGTGSSTNRDGSNDWTDARLMMLLNPGYETPSDVYSYEGSLYWNSKSGTCYSRGSDNTTSCDFTSTGLKNDTTRNMIEEVTWNLGGCDINSVYSNQIYSYERGTTVYSGRPTSWTGKIALMYPSDYGYATDFNKCTEDLYNYDSSTDSYACRTNDWLFNSASQWLLTPHSSYSDYVWHVARIGDVLSKYEIIPTADVRPVLYLDSKLTIGSGNGSSSSPYRLSVS